VQEVPANEKFFLLFDVVKVDTAETKNNKKKKANFIYFPLCKFIKMLTRKVKTNKNEKKKTQPKVLNWFLAKSQHFFLRLPTRIIIITMI
jgi:hypothetical protein